MKKNKLVLFVFLIQETLLFGQSTTFPSIDKKFNEIYALQKEISNNVSASSNLSPITIPDPRTMVSINQSGNGIIKIPLLNVKGRKLTLPLNLTYVTSGIKVDQKSSEVGLGWEINIGSIVRNYGAFEPDYTYIGSEFQMLYNNGSPLHDKKLSTSSRTFQTTNENQHLDYDNIISSKGPDDYFFNVPGLQTNDFWNTNSNIPPYGATLAVGDTPIFKFSQMNSWLIQYQKANFNISQEVSKINELNNNFPFYRFDDCGTMGMNSDVSSAIALYPYVIHQNVDELVYFFCGSGGHTGTVQYEDYSKFIITTSDGTKYIFGRPLREQKYLFSEEPFWSSLDGTHYSAVTYRTYSSGADDRVFNQYWKTDFIGEWLLTEIRSNDYVDANSNGIADDGDYGDWIKIEYNTDLKREFLNFTQTDQTSSLWKERAYVQKITTPIEQILFTREDKFDVDHDYFKEPFNRLNSDYKYYTSGAYLINYPVELQRYKSITVKQNFPSSTVYNSQVQNINLIYADKGSPQELAVSNDLIIRNEGTSVNYDPSSLGGSNALSEFNFSSEIGRGKSTLKGLEFRGISSTSDNVSGVSLVSFFQYRYMLI